MPKLLNVEPVDELTVHLKYDDDLKGKVDLSKAIERNQFTELKEKSEFSKVYVDEFTNELCWPSGARMCANALYKQLELLELMRRLKIDIDNE